MQVIITNTLTSNQYHDATSLINICKESDNTRGISFLEPEMNAISGFPCFYLLYNGNVLVSLLSIFLPNETECEIYANTLPSCRRNGYFDRLMDSALSNIHNYGIKKILIVNEPGCTSGTEFLNSSPNAHFSYSEYLMSYNMKTIPAPKGILTIEYHTTENTEIFTSSLNGVQIGSCNVEHNRGVATIYDFNVIPAMRGKGYGTETLLLVLKRLLDSKCHKILLQVNGANKAAHAMYSHHGFVHQEQIDYWEYQ